MKKVMLVGKQVTFRTKISNSKQELARIISENGQWRDGAQFYVSTCNGIVICSKSKPKYTSKYGWVAPGGFIDDRIEVSSYLKNWHQTILSRDEYFHLYPAPDADGWIEWKSDTRTMEVPKPTIEQLAADYRNAKDYAERKQQEADDAKADADEALRKLELAGEAIGLVVTPITAKQESELVITDWRDLRVGDVIELTGSVNPCWKEHSGSEMTVKEVYRDQGDNDDQVDLIGESGCWSLGGNTTWRFIRRP